MKKLVSILILFVFLFNIGGFYVVIKSKQYAIRKEIKRKIKKGVPEADLIPITINDANQHLLEWKHSKEFRLYGSMYDIVRKEIGKDHEITYFCILDDEESELFKGLDKLVQKTLKDRNKGVLEIEETLNLFFENNLLVIAEPRIKIQLSSYTIYKDKQLEKIDLEVPCPPPDIL